MMRRNEVTTAALWAIACLFGPMRAAAEATPDVPALARLAERWANERAAARGTAFDRLQASRSPLVVRQRADLGLSLQWIDGRGLPRYYALDNLAAAQTVSTDDVQPLGSAGLALDGSATPEGRLGLWDGGSVRTTHTEFGGRAVQRDTALVSSYHATHVAGTMVAAGVDGASIGMSPAAPLHCYEWTSDIAEMAAAAATGMRLSNHSYSPSAGWRMSQGQWYWYGDVSISTTEDYGFGFYGSDAQAWDQIAFDAPGYLIVGSAGNNRNEFGPGSGGDHAIWDGTIWVPSTDTRDRDGGLSGYDTIPWTKTAKNALIVGAVGDLASGYLAPLGVTMTSFSGFGPTDDGRIKPDLVANGVSLWSCTDGSDNARAFSSGTSMAAPNVTGSLNLLVDHWSATHGGAGPRAATLKALVVQTANECGADDGPDYRFGWGLLNTAAAAAVISSDAADSAGAHVWEKRLMDGAVDIYEFVLGHAETVRFTLAWTDPAGTPVAAALDPTDAMLVNDLELRLTDNVTTWQPWILDPANPSSPATTGDNFRDNAEQVFVATLPAGSYSIRVSHDGNLTNGAQDYSLVGSHAVTQQVPLAAESRLPADDGSLHASPNPFRSSTTLRFQLVARERVNLGVFDVHGRLVRAIIPGTFREPGLYRVDWDGRRVDGTPVSSGVYFAKLETGSASRVQKMVVVRPR